MARAARTGATPGDGGPGVTGRMSLEKGRDAAVHRSDEFEEERITLTDEDGHEHEFTVLDVIEVDDREYAILVPAEEEEELTEADAEAVIFRLETDEDGEEVLVDVDDDEEFNRVARAWEEMMEQEDEEDEEEEEDEDEE